MRIPTRVPRVVAPLVALALSKITVTRCLYATK